MASGKAVDIPSRVEIKVTPHEAADGRLDDWRRDRFVLLIVVAFVFAPLDGPRRRGYRMTFFVCCSA
jgi:hypothetical protein